jgi:hypothetical protein
MTYQQELEYLQGALQVLNTELGTARDKIEVMERIQNIKDCIVRLVLSNESAGRV